MEADNSNGTCKPVDFHGENGDFTINTKNYRYY